MENIELKQVSQLKWDVYYNGVLYGTILFNSFDQVWHSNYDNFKTEYCEQEDAIKSLLRE